MLSSTTHHVGDVHVSGGIHLLRVMVLFSEGLPGSLVLLRLASLRVLLVLGGVAIGSCHVPHLLVFGFFRSLTLPAPSSILNLSKSSERANGAQAVLKFTRQKKKLQAAQITILDAKGAPRKSRW